MDMEDHHNIQYGSMADLCRQFMNSRHPHLPPPADVFSGHRSFAPGGQNYEMMLMGRHHQVGEMIPLSATAAAADSTVAVAAGNTTTNMTVVNSCGGNMSAFEAENGCFNGGDGGNGRWPRQETLTLLEIRSRLDSKFKEANQKGPLWDEVSRIMSDEHGYQRSGKKCREKFENLYKYYKKTKEGKAGRQDGKHYRFFRQLEALYGESSSSNPTSVQETQFVSNNSLRFQTANNITSRQANQEAFQSQRNWDSVSLSTSLGFESSSSDDSSSVKENESSERRRRRKGPSKWKTKIKDFIDSQMRKLMEKQEAWFDKMMNTLEQKEQERLRREEEWKKQEAARLGREQRFWAKERAWIEARDAALMDALHRFTGRELNTITSPEEIIATETNINQSCENQNDDGSDQTLNNNISRDDNWADPEVTRLIELRTSMESRFQRSGCSDELLWEEVAARMACLGYDRSAVMCKEKWDSICDDYTRRSRIECNKKRKENSRGFSYFQSDESIYSQGGAMYGETGEQGQDITRLQTNGGTSPSSCNAVNGAMPDSCLRFLMGDGENLWESYGLKLNK